MNLTERFQNIAAAISGKTAKREKLARKVTQQQVMLIRQDIGKWRMAQTAAKDLNSPNRELLYNLYEDLLIDSHLQSVIQTRKINVTGKPFKLVNVTNGEEDMTKTSLFKSPWFSQFMELALDSIFWGHSLIEFGDLIDGQFTEVLLVPRANVIPEFGLIRMNVYGSGQIYDYRNNPSFWMIEVGEERDLGLLEKAAPHVLWKKAASAAWSEYCEIFGMPIRIGKTDSNDAKEVARLEANLRDMGAAAYAVLAHDEEIDFVQTSQSDAYMVYDQRIERVNSEISKLILGQTMTSDNGSSRSQGEVHERVAEAYAKNDMKKLADVINHKLIPFLVERGYPLQGFMFEWDFSESLGLKDQWAIVNEVLQRGYDVPEEYITQTFGIPVTKKPEPTPIQPNFKKPEQVTAQLTRQNGQITAYYTNTHVCSSQITASFDATEMDDLIEKLIEDIHAAGSVPVLDEALYNRIYSILSEAVTVGYGATSADQVAFLLEHVQVFSAFKTYHELRAFSDLLVDVTGQLRTFSEFKKEALKVHEQYNKKWLRTEYNHAVASSQQAAKWNDYEEGAILRYETVGDGRVRDAHKKYDLITLPKSNPFWDTYYPPNEWNCRCTVVQVEEDSKHTPAEDYVNLPKPGVFANNVGKTGVIFPETHPYFDVQEEVREQLNSFVSNVRSKEQD